MAWPALALALAFGCASASPSVASPEADQSRADQAQADHPEAGDVRAAVDATFAAMKAHDADALRALVAPGAIIVRVAKAEDGTVRHAVVPDQAFIDGTAGDDRVEIDERFLEPAAVRVDGDIATAWGRYDVRIDGEVHHCGIDAVALARLDGRWQITAITYTAVPCDG